MQDIDAVGRAVRDVMHANSAETVQDVDWAATMIVGAEFVMEEMLVEIEVDAVTGY